MNDLRSHLKGSFFRAIVWSSVLTLKFHEILFFSIKFSIKHQQMPLGKFARS